MFRGIGTEGFGCVLAGLWGTGGILILKLFTVMNIPLSLNDHTIRTKHDEIGSKQVDPSDTLILFYHFHSNLWTLANISPFWLNIQS